MSKIPFDIKYRPQIECGEYKVETRDGKPARIVCWDLKGNEDFFILALVEKNQKEVSYCYPATGCCKAACDIEGKDDLFLVTSEPEMNEFEQEVYKITTNKVRFKEEANKLLDLAREQLIKEGYVVEKKAFHDKVENISDKHQAEMSVEYSIHCKVKDGTRNAVMNWDTFQKVAQKFIDIGKAEALKDLPKWKEIRDNGCVDADGDTYTDCLCLLKRGWYQVMSSGTKVGGESRYLSIRDLEKLPEFKEDSHE